MPMDVIEETLAENNIAHSSVIKMIMTMVTMLMVLLMDKFNSDQPILSVGNHLIHESSCHLIQRLGAHPGDGYLGLVILKI